MWSAKLTTEFWILASSGIAASRISTIRIACLLRSDLAERDFEGADAILDVAPSDDQRRIEVDAHIGAVARHPRQQPGIIGVLAELAHRGVRVGHVGDVADDARQQPDRRDLGDPRHALPHAVELVPKHALHRGGIADEVLVLGDVEGRHRGGAGDGMAGIGVEMQQRLVEEDLVDAARDGDGPHRDVAAGQPLGIGDDVALHAEMLGAEHLAGPPEAADDLVDDEEDAVGVADPAQPGEVVRMGNLDRAGYRDGLGNHRGDRARAFARNQRLELREGEFGRAGPFAVAEPVASRRFGLEEIRCQRPEAGPEGGDTGRRGGRNRGAVIRAGARDDLGARRLAAPGMVGAGDLEGELVRFAARVGEGEHRLLAHRDLRQALGELGNVDVRDTGIKGDELERPGLLGDAPGDLGTTMADLAGAEVAAGVEQAVAVLVEDVGTLAADDHLGVARRDIRARGRRNRRGSGGHAAWRGRGRSRWPGPPPVRMWSCLAVLEGAHGGSGPHHEGVLNVVAQFAPDALGLQILVDRLDAVLPADAARLVAAERRIEGHRAVHVDPHRAGLELARDAVGAADVERPDAGGEAEGGAVGDARPPPPRPRRGSPPAPARTPRSGR